MDSLIVLVGTLTWLYILYALFGVIYRYAQSRILHDLSGDMQRGILFISFVFAFASVYLLTYKQIALFIARLIVG